MDRGRHPPFGSIEQFDQVLAHLPEEPAGLEARYVGQADDGTLRVVTLWAAKADADRFFAEVLAPALAQLDSPAADGPRTLGIGIARSYVREAVA